MILFLTNSRRFSAMLSVFVGLTACLSLKSAAQIDTHLQATNPKSVQSLSYAGATAVPIDDLYYTRSIGGTSWSPDGKEIVLSTNLSGRTNLWKVTATGSWPVQLSQSEDAQLSPTYSPDGKWVVYQQDKGGNELYDLYAISSSGGTPINLTNTPETRELSPEFSADGNWLVFDAKTSKSPNVNVMAMDWHTHAVRALTAETTPNHYWGRICWSHDGKYIFAARMEKSFADSDV